MIHSVLVEKLSKYWLIQAILAYLPCIFIIIYIVVYMCDMLNVMSIITYNDKITKSDLELGNLKEVIYYEETDSGDYTATITGEDTYTVEVELGDLIYSVYIQSLSWYNIVTCDGDSLHQTSIDFVDDITETDDGYQVSYNDITFDLESGDKLLDVYLADDGSYEVDLNCEDIESYNVDELNSLQVLLKTDTGYRIQISSAYTLSTNGVEINICSNLPTDNVYYNESTKSYVKNISEDFSRTLIISSNIIVVLFSMTIYCILICIVRRQKELKIMCRPDVLFVNIFAILLLPLAMAVTMALI